MYTPLYRLTKNSPLHLTPLHFTLLMTPFVRGLSRILCGYRKLRCTNVGLMDSRYQFTEAYLIKSPDVTKWSTVPPHV